MSCSFAKHEVQVGLVNTGFLMYKVTSLSVNVNTCTCILVLQQLNDSSVIISAMTTYMSTDEKDLQRIISYFPQMESQDKKSKKSVEFANRYEIMTGKPGRTESEKYVSQAFPPEKFV